MYLDERAGGHAVLRSNSDRAALSRAICSWLPP
jgi:hypothetical protein